MSDEAQQRCAEWKDYGSDRWAGRCGIGIASNILAIEARLDALESSRAVQPATETAAAGANDPGREVEPQTLPPRETWPHNIRPRGEMDHLINHEPFPTLDRDPPRNEAIACPSLVAAVRRLLDSVNRRHPDKDPRQWTCPHMQALDDMTQPFASVVAEQAASDGPGDGYRWVQLGETLEKSDEYFGWGGWKETGAHGEACKYCPQYRRRITPAATEASNWPGKGYRWVLHGEAWEDGDERCVGGNHHTGVYEWEKITDPLSVCMRSTSVRRRITPVEAVPVTKPLSESAATEETSQAVPAESVSDDAGRRLVNGEPMTVAELIHALGVAIEEIRRLTSEVERLEKETDELRGHSDFDDQQIAKLTAERDAAMAEAHRHARHRMTREEREIIEELREYWTGKHVADVLWRLLDRTKEGE